MFLAVLSPCVAIVQLASGDCLQKWAQRSAIHDKWVKFSKRLISQVILLLVIRKTLKLFYDLLRKVETSWALLLE
jgi:hypothetical protein